MAKSTTKSTKKTTTRKKATASSRKTTTKRAAKATATAEAPKTSTKKKTTSRSRKKTTTKKSAKPEIVITMTHDQIAERAYQIWVEKGRPTGTDSENWAEAEAQLRELASAKV